MALELDIFGTREKLVVVKVDIVELGFEEHMIVVAHDLRHYCSYMRGLDDISKKCAAYLL